MRALTNLSNNHFTNQSNNRYYLPQGWLLGCGLPPKLSDGRGGARGVEVELRPGAWRGRSERALWKTRKYMRAINKTNDIIPIKKMRLSLLSFGAADTPIERDRRVCPFHARNVQQPPARFDLRDGVSCCSRRFALNHGRHHRHLHTVHVLDRWAERPGYGPARHDCYQSLFPNPHYSGAIQKQKLEEEVV